MSRNGLHAIASWLRSQQIGSRQQKRSASDYPALRFEACSTGLRFSRLFSQREEALGRELTRSHARFVEELLAEEEELTRVATKVVRLQSLIRSQEHLLGEMVHSHEDQQESSLFLAGVRRQPCRHRQVVRPERVAEHAPVSAELGGSHRPARRETGPTTFPSPPCNQTRLQTFLPCIFSLDRIDDFQFFVRT